MLICELHYELTSVYLHSALSVSKKGSKSTNYIANWWQHMTSWNLSVWTWESILQYCQKALAH